MVVVSLRDPGVDRDGATLGENLGVEPAVGGGGHLDDGVHTVGRDFAYLRRDVTIGVVDDVLRTGRRSQAAFGLAADGGEHRCAGPPRELDGGVADRPGTPGDQHEAPGEGAGAEPLRAALVAGEAPVRGHERHAEARPQIEAGVVGQRGHQRLRQQRVLLRSALRAPVRGLTRPHPPTDESRVDAGADRLDHAGTVVVGHLRRVDRHPGRGAGARLPVGRVHPGTMDAHPHPARPGTGQRFVGRPQHGVVAGLGEHDGAHRELHIVGAADDASDPAARPRISAAVPRAAAAAGGPRPRLRPAPRRGRRAAPRRDR